MAYIRQSPSKAGKDAIEYCRDGKFDKFWGKDSEEVSECLLVDQTNMLPDEVMRYEEQMSAYWNHFGNPNHKNEVRRVIVSFAPDEIDNSRYEDGDFVDWEAPYKALEITKAFCEQTYPDRQIAYFVQADGKRHAKNDQPKLHVHVIVNDWDMETGHGVPTELTDAKNLAHAFTKFAKDYVFESGEEFHLTKDHDKNMKTLDKEYKRRDKKSWFEKQVSDGIIPKKDEDGLYNSYKDYIADMIAASHEVVKSEDEFKEFMSERGIDVALIESKKRGTYFKYTVQDDYIAGRGTHPVVKAPRTNNPGIGEDKLQKWTDVDVTRKTILEIAERNAGIVMAKSKVEKWNEEWDNIIEVDERDSAFDDMLSKLKKEKEPKEEPEKVAAPVPENPAEPIYIFVGSPVYEKPESEEIEDQENDQEQIATETKVEEIAKTKIDEGGVSQNEAIQTAMQKGEGVLETEKKQRQRITPDFGIGH